MIADSNATCLPMVTVGEAVPGTEMGNAMTGISAVGLILQGSSFPLTLAYSRSGSSLEENSPSNSTQGLLNGAQTGLTSSVFTANWMLRFRNLPVVALNYTDTDYNSQLPTQFGSNNDYTLRDYTAQATYNKAGWQVAGRCQLTQSNTEFPDVISGNVQSDNGTTTDLGFTASRLLPLHSIFGVSADDSKSDYNWDGEKTDIAVRIANATLTSQPLERLSTTLQAQYTSNMQAYQEQQAVASTGVPGATGSTPTSQVPVTFLSAPFKVVTLGLGVGLQLVHGFSLNGSASESRTPDSGDSTRWTGGPAYQHKWASGFVAASYSYSRMVTREEILADSVETGETTPQSETQEASDYTPFSEAINLNNVAGNMSQYLPESLKLTASAHISKGTIEDDGVPYPNHDYGGIVTLTRPLGEWTLTGNFTIDKNAASTELEYNQSSSKGVSIRAAYRGFSLTGGRQYGNGLALQVGNSLLFITNPVAVAPVLGTPTLSNTTGTTLTGTYRSRRGFLVVTGNWGRFDYTTNQLNTQNNLVNLHASYKFRRLRFIAGFVRQSQLYSIGPSGTYETRLMYFQVERNFRLF